MLNKKKFRTISDEELLWIGGWVARTMREELGKALDPIEVRLKSLEVKSAAAEEEKTFRTRTNIVVPRKR